MIYWLRLSHECLIFKVLLVKHLKNPGPVWHWHIYWHDLCFQQHIRGLKSKIYLGLCKVELIQTSGNVTYLVIAIVTCHVCISMSQCSNLILMFSCCYFAACLCRDMCLKGLVARNLPGYVYNCWNQVALKKLHEECISIESQAEITNWSKDNFAIVNSIISINLKCTYSRTLQLKDLPRIRELCEIDSNSALTVFV